MGFFVFRNSPESRIKYPFGNIEASVGTAQPIRGEVLPDIQPIVNSRGNTMTKAKAIVMSFEQFAQGCGRSDGMTLNASDAYHKQYLTLDADGKADWEMRYVTNYVVGYTDSRTTLKAMTLDQAVKAYGKKRTERTRTEELAVNAGKAKFRYHISRPEKSDGKKKAVAVPKQLVSNIVTEIIEAGLTRDQFDALLAQLRQSVSFQ